MLHSLWFKLVGALAAVVAVALIVVALTASLVATRQFGLYAERGGKVWAEQLTPLLADTYNQDGGWQNAQDVLTNPWGGVGGAQHRFGMGPMMAPGGPHPPDAGPDHDMWGVMNIHLLLADSQGTIVADTQGGLRGQPLAGDLLQSGTPILVDQQQVGTLVVIANEPPALIDRADNNFLIPTLRSVLLAALAAGGVGIILGTVLFRRITRPLKQLEQAVRTVESGELTARAPVTSRDEIGRVAEAFNQMTARLERQHQLRKQMVGDIAHELRTPLSVMQGTIEAMLDGVLHPNKTELRNLHNDIRRLTRMVEDLRTLSLADEGQLRLEMIEINPAALVEQVTHSMLPMAQEKSISLTTQVDQALPAIHADGDRLAEVVTNLIGNALRYSQDGGRVDVSARRSGDRVVLAVRDDGPGIPPEDVPFVFERFWRGDKSRSRGSGGSGIGLAIVKQLVDLHGGTVSVDSTIGEGTVFQVALPLA
jgi:signal transduction histidine kinase